MNTTHHKEEISRPLSRRAKALLYTIPALSTLALVAIFAFGLHTPSPASDSLEVSFVQEIPQGHEGATSYDDSLDLMILADMTKDGGYRQTTAYINGAHFHLDIAEENHTRTLGLSNRQLRDPHRGMLFVFPTTAKHGIWMKDMNFAIDIIWLNEAREVIDVVYNVSPDTFPEVFKPQKEARYVIEVPAQLGETN